MRAHFQSGKAQEFLCIRIGVATVAMVVAAFSRAFLTPRALMRAEDEHADASRVDGDTAARQT